LVGHVGAEDAGLHRRAVRVQRGLDQTCVGAGVLAKADDALDSGASGAALKPPELRIDAVDDRGAARLKPEKDLGLGLGDGVDRAEEFKMNRLDGGDDRHVRAYQTTERLDLASV